MPPVKGTTSAKKRARRSRRRYYVYVVELCAKGLDTDLGRECYYVGATGETPLERLIKHKRGGRTANAEVRDYGTRLRLDLSKEWGPYASRAEALRAEKTLGEHLESKGFRVWGADGREIDLRPRSAARST